MEKETEKDLRNRVQQITGTTNNMQRRSGICCLPLWMTSALAVLLLQSNRLPKVSQISLSGLVEYEEQEEKKLESSVSHAKGSPPNGSSGRSIALPAAAAWGLRVSNGRPPVSTPVCLGGVARQKTDTNSSSFPAVGTSAAQGSTLHLNVATKSDESGENLLLHPNSSSGSLESSNHCTVRDSIETISDSPAEIARGAVPAAINSTNHSPRLITSKDSEGPMIAPNSGTHCTELDRPASSSSVSDRGVTASLPIYTFCNGLSSVGIDEDCRVRNSDISSNGSVPNLPSLRPPGSEGVQQYYQEHFKDPLTSSLPSRNTVLESDGDSVSRELFDWREDPTPPVLPNARSEADDVLLAFDDWRSKVSENGDSSNYRNACSSSISGSKNMIFEADETFCQFNNTGLPNGYHDNKVSSSNVDKGKYFGSFKDDSAEKSAAVDMGESSIISNILSMDPDIWGDSLTSPHDLVKLLSENDKQHTTLKLPSSLKVQNSNQSRFSFARQEDFANQGCDLEASLSNNESMRPKYTAAQDCFVNRDPFEKLRNGFSANMFGESDTFSSNLPVAPHSKHSVSRTQISAPPGFSFPNRAPPPGFSSQERMDQAFESFSGNNLVDSSFLRNQYVGHPTGSFGSVADVELIDPAILAVGKGRLPNGANSAGLDMRSAFTTQQSTSENDPRYFLMQQQISGHQNLRYPDHVGDRFSSFNDAYRGPSRLLEQSQVSNFFPFGQLSLHQSRNGHISNGHWDGWNEVQSGNELGMAELLRNERLGLNKHLSGYEDLKFRMPTSSDIYSRAFGI
ncbi:hypothetical protein IFM89_021740 [Coptis chinensis]|uniref:CCR4-NOT transcription complex subunit 4 n=1 Tax=Coptis chinensis TaxID=261450 RepID=A0A835LN34_9MAGN|nr:hypothetical protein IFM89_021740 [Coptis chinensis]